MYASTQNSSRRVLLLAVAGSMIAAAALAIGILLFGDYGGTEGRILITTLILAAHGVLAVPFAILHDRHRLPWLALAGAALVTAGAVLNVVAVWVNSDSEVFGKVIGTVWALLVPTVVAAALAARPRRHRLFPVSVGLAYGSAGLLISLIWAEPENDLFFRVLGALVVLTVLLVALQPLLLRARPDRVAQPLRLVDDAGTATEVVVVAESLADAAVSAIRDAEREGRHVRSVELVRR